MQYTVTDKSYSEADFTDVQYMTAREKMLTFRQWVRFLDSGMSIDQWAKSKRVYHHLMQHCGHIAHYDAGGFYHAQFAQPEDRVQFLGYVMRDESAGFGGRRSLPDYQDLNDAMRAALTERHKVLNALAGDAMVENRRHEVARLEREIAGLTGDA